MAGYYPKIYVASIPIQMPDVNRRTRGHDELDGSTVLLVYRAREDGIDELRCR